MGDTGGDTKGPLERGDTGGPKRAGESRAHALPWQPGPQTPLRLRHRAVAPGSASQTAARRKCCARVPGPSRALRACPATGTGTATVTRTGTATVTATGTRTGTGTATMVKPRYKGRCTINPSRASTNPGTGGPRAGPGWTGLDRTEADVLLSPQIASGAREGTTCGTERPSGVSTCTGRRSAGERGPARGGAQVSVAWPRSRYRPGRAAPGTGDKTPRCRLGVAPPCAL